MPPVPRTAGTESESNSCCMSPSGIWLLGFQPEKGFLQIVGRANRVQPRSASVTRNRSSLGVQVVLPRTPRCPAEQPLRFFARDSRRIGTRDCSQFDLPSVVLAQNLLEVPTSDV